MKKLPTLLVLIIAIAAMACNKTNSSTPVSKVHTVPNISDGHPDIVPARTYPYTDTFVGSESIIALGCSCGMQYDTSNVRLYVTHNDSSAVAFSCIVHNPSENCPNDKFVNAEFFSHMDSASTSTLYWTLPNHTSFTFKGDSLQFSYDGPTYGCACYTSSNFYGRKK